MKFRRQTYASITRQRIIFALYPVRRNEKTLSAPVCRLANGKIRRTYARTAARDIAPSSAANRLSCASALLRRFARLFLRENPMHPKKPFRSVLPEGLASFSSVIRACVCLLVPEHRHDRIEYGNSQKYYPSGMPPVQGKTEYQIHHNA